MSLEDSIDASDAVARVKLEKLGYKQEMPRSRGSKNTLFTIMAVPYGLATKTSFAGGSAEVIWGWILVSILTQSLALSLAEICSKYPTSAGTYYWCYRLASPRRRVLASWMNGWFTVVGAWTIALSVTFGVAEFVVADIIFLGVTAVACLFCLFLNKHLPVIDVSSRYGFSLILIRCQIILILICVSTKAAAKRNSIYDALGKFDESYSPWPPELSYFVGLLPVRSLLYIVHNPSEILPKAITWSIPIGTLSGVIFLLPFLFTLPDHSIGPGGFVSVMGSRAGGFGLPDSLNSIFKVFGIGMFCAISTSCAASRATWAFARDKGIPFHQRSQRSILLGSIYLGSKVPSINLLTAESTDPFTAAFDAFVGVATMCLGTSYAMPVAISLINDRNDMRDAPFNLGGFGYVINIVAVIWTMFVMVQFVMLVVFPFTLTNGRSYVSAVFVGLEVISVVWYLLIGRFYYTGPSIPDE
ncbi:hypothetical protein BDR07DRAFT_1414080 [Suillus spraguei]|nr:hypothetical protein BDR07DRAFT_1414080 [Suillus spraguei]